MPSQCTFGLNEHQNQSVSVQNYTDDEQLETVDDLELVRYEHYQTMIPILLSLCALAMVINITVLVISSRSKKPVSLTLKLTLGLAAADIYTSAILGAGLYLHSYLLYVQCYMIPHYFCIAFVVESLRLGAILASVLHLLLLAINHYVATKAPIFYRRQFMFLSNRQITAYITGIWILPALLFIGIFSVIPNQAFQAENCEVTEILADVYFRCLIFGLLLAPLLIMACLYTALICLITNLDSGSLAKLQQMHWRRRKRMIGTALLIVCSFLIAWLPGAIWYLLTCPKCPLSYLELQYHNPRMLILISTMANLLMISKGLVNPVIYAWRIPELREAWERWRKHRSETWSQRTSYASTAYASIPGTIAQRGLCLADRNNEDVSHSMILS